MTDPWSVQKSDIAEKEDISAPNGVVNGKSELEESTKSFGFEDSFIADNNSHKEGDDNGSAAVIEINSNSSAAEHQPLPDSQTYLKGLERKLEKLKKSSKLVDALAEKREDCLRNLVQNDSPNSGSSENNLLLELEASILNNDSAVHNIYRQLQPVQPVTVGETVHIVKYDQLEEQRLELEAAEEEDDSPASR